MSLQELRGLPLPRPTSIFRLVRFDGDPRINPRHKPFLAAATVVTPSEICMNPLHTDCVICITYEKSPRNRVCTWLAWSRMKAAKVASLSSIDRLTKGPDPPRRRRSCRRIVTISLLKTSPKMRRFFFHNHDASQPYDLSRVREKLSRR